MSLTPENQAKLKEYAQGIAKILYADADQTLTMWINLRELPASLAPLSSNSKFHNPSQNV
jgi:hypothetical protein